MVSFGGDDLDQRPLLDRSAIAYGIDRLPSQANCACRQHGRDCRSLLTDQFAQGLDLMRDQFLFARRLDENPTTDGCLGPPFDNHKQHDRYQDSRRRHVTGTHDHPTVDERDDDRRDKGTR